MISRRQFLKVLGSAAIVSAVPRLPFLPVAKAADRPFNLLVVGDSLIAGQGLREENRFYHIVGKWIEQEMLPDGRIVNLKSKSHSGSRIYLHQNEIRALRDAEKDLEKFYHREVNFTFPDIRTQVDVARREYGVEGVAPVDVDMIMVSGGITNIGTANISNPFRKNSSLRRKITRYCDGWMYRFLSETAEIFPNALFVVIGYFPFVSKKSSTSKVYNAILELYDFPGFTKPVMNNFITKHPFKILHNKMAKRSKVWHEESDKAYLNAVGRFNDGKGRAIYVRSPIHGENCFGTKNSIVFEVGKKGRVLDEVFDTRKLECDKAISDVEDVKLKFKRRFCEMSAIGHPNVEGSRAYAENIKNALRPVLQSSASIIS